MSQKKQRVARNKQKKQLRRKQRVQQSRQMAPARLSHKIADRLDEAYDLIRNDRYDEATEVLLKLDSRGNYANVVEALVFLYQTTGNHRACCEAAERLTKLRPQDPEARLIYAQEAMCCGWATIALANYQQFIECWPDHPFVSKAKNALEILVPETQQRMKNLQFPQENAFQSCFLHEQSLALLQNGRFEECVAKCQELLVLAPHSPQARNNLALAYFQSGRVKEAVDTADETLRNQPDNHFAKATLAKLYFLTGCNTEAQKLADQIVNDPPTAAHQDALVNAMETLAFLGRDEDVIRLAELADVEIMDDQSEAALLHYLAYAQCRLNDKSAAKASWKRCLKVSPHLQEARLNLDDLNAGAGHAPWAAPLTKWVPKEIITATAKRGSSKILAGNPYLTSLIPALLDRGDPVGREFAMRLAMADRSKSMLEALKNFALGSRGSDALRFEALQFLRDEKFVDAGPHRIYRCGEWKQVQLITTKITHQALPSNSSPRVLALMADGINAMKKGDWQTAEAALTDALQEEPDNCSAIYNLCVVWRERDGIAGERRAITRLQQLHEQHPDYTFAAITLAQFAAAKGNFQEARELLSPCLRAPHLHISEATALLAAQAQNALAENDVDAAEQALDMLAEIADENDPLVIAVRHRLDRVTTKKGLLRFLGLR